MSSNPPIDAREPPVEVSDLPSETAARPPGWLAAILSYLGIALLLCCFRLGSTDVITMEGIVADGARHMARTHEVAVPRLHGEIYSYKPPLAYWLALASFRTFGEETEWSLRLPFALSGLLMGLAVLWLAGGVVGPRIGLLCALASLTGVLALQKLYLAEFDIPLAAGVGVAVAVACRNFAGARPSAALWWIGYLGLAFGFLAKGIPALMFYGPGLLLAAVTTRRFKALFAPAHLAGVLVFLAVVAGWVASAFAAEGWAVFEQPLAEAGDKGFTWSLSGVGSTLVKPLVAWALFLPWTLLVPLSFEARESPEDPVRRMGIAAGSFVAAGVGVFMLVPATESRYLLPLTVPAGILCGIGARDVLIRGAGRIRRRVIEVLVLVVGLCAIAVSFVASEASSVPERVLLALCAGATVGLVGYGWRAGWRRHAVWLVCAAALLSWLAQVVVARPHRASSRSMRSVAADFDRHLAAGESVWTAPVSKDFRHSSLFFYLRRPVETSSADGGGPETGDYLVLFSDEHEDLIQQLPTRYTVVESRVWRTGLEILLARAGPVKSGP